MAKRVVAAVSPDGSLPPLYLLGYRDDGAGWTCRWTPSWAHARWFDADEAEVEALLLAPLLPGPRVPTPQRLGG